MKHLLLLAGAGSRPEAAAKQVPVVAGSFEAVST